MSTRSKTSLLVVLVLAMGVMASCGRENSAENAPRGGATAPTAGPTADATWEGAQPERLGDISVDEFNDFIDQTNPPWAGSPLRAALEFVQGSSPSEEPLPATTTVIQETSPEIGTEAVVTLTEEGLLDDAIAAVRYQLTFLQEEGRWRLSAAHVDQKCARGDQPAEEFTVESCV